MFFELRGEINIFVSWQIASRDVVPKWRMVCGVDSFQFGRCFTRRWPSTNEEGSDFSGD